jgi:fumarylacetoacetase
MTVGLDHLPYGSVVTADGRRRAVVRHDDHLLDLATLDAGLFGTGTLDAFLAAGRVVWGQVRAAATDRLRADPGRLLACSDVTPVLPFSVADYVDFYASEQHATNAGRIFRPESEPLPANWKHLPIGYTGRAGTVVVSGTAVRRPNGFRRTADGVGFGPSARLDFEAEVAFVVGRGSEAGSPVAVADFAEHVFGLALLNDWSARDIQAFETVPLGPFLGKSFATSISAWITPLAALDAARVGAPPRSPAPAPHLDDSAAPNGLDLNLTVSVNGAEVSRPPFATMYWTGPQLLAHLTSNGTLLRPGDVLGSGTVSGPDPGQWGSLLELSWNGTRPVAVGAQTRTWLEDGDEVTLSATAPAPDGGRIALGEVRGRIVAG